MGFKEEDVFLEIPGIFFNAGVDEVNPTLTTLLARSLFLVKLTIDFIGNLVPVFLPSLGDEFFQDGVLFEGPRIFLRQNFKI